MEKPIRRQANLRLSENLISRIRQLAKERETSMNYIVENILRDALFPENNLYKKVIIKCPIFTKIKKYLKKLINKNA